VDRFFAILIGLILLLLGVAGYLAMPKSDGPEAPVAVMGDDANIQPLRQAQPATERPCLSQSGASPTPTSRTASAPVQEEVVVRPTPSEIPSIAHGPLVANWEKSYQDALVATPAALADPDPTLDLSEDQVVVWNRLRQTFVDSLGFQNPYDPNYLKRWTAAQPELDERFRAMFGEEAFIKQQSQASHQN